MSAPIPRIRQNDTRAYTASYSSMPSVPLFNVFQGSGAGTLVYSALATATSSLDFVAYFAPSSAGLLSYTFTASFSSGRVVDPQPPGLIQCLRVTPG